jgi:hypothetical protein
MLVLDYAATRPGAAAIKRAGYGGAVRYIGFPSRTKCTNAGELADFTRHALGMALVYEDSATDWLGGLAGGRAAGARARNHANQIGFPRTRPIYMAVDRDVVTGGQFATMVEYLRGASQTVGGVGLTGVYGEYDVCVRARQAGVARWFWQCRAWSGTPVKLFPGRHLYQRAGTVNVGGVSCDVNDVLQQDWGHHTEDDVSASDVFNYRINRQGSSLGGVTTLGAVVANIDRAWEMQAARDQAILAAIAAEKGVTPEKLGSLIDEAVATHRPTPDEIAAAQRDLVEAAVREVVAPEQADQIIQKIAEQLSERRG